MGHLPCGSGHTLGTADHLAAAPCTARAQNGASAAEGDSKLSVLYKCGQPVMTDAFCAPLYAPGSPYPVPAAMAGIYLPCLPVEEWLYDRGPGNLMATVRFRDSRVLAIRYGRLPE